MVRYFNNKKIELLAPAGNFEIFKDIVNTNCDALFFGGKNFNMRLHRKGFNFSNEELKDAIEMAHEKDKCAYITLNNVYNCSETEPLKEFLYFLETIKPDALIVQDLSVLHMIRELKINLEVHSSIMMNTHNIEMIKALEKLGVTRVVMSREASLPYIKSLPTTMEYEYFIHGDMCVAHGGQCFYSGILFGQSSNRGKCLKICRWNYPSIETADGKQYATEYPLAVKDMSMYEYIPELIHHNITSFKIEGRMRDSEYLQIIINAYGDAIDRYVEDPICFDRKKDSELLYENRKRDCSTAYAFGKPGLSFNNKRYEGTGKLYSTGKVFSTPTKEREIKPEKIEEINTVLKGFATAPNNEKMKLAVKVNSLAQAKICIGKGVDSVYLSGDVYLPDLPFSKEDIRNITSKKGSTKVYLCMPHMTFDIDLEEYEMLLRSELGIDGLVTTNLGAIEKFKEFNQIGDYCLSIMNGESASFYKKMGVERLTISVESNLKEAMDLIQSKKVDTELIVHGSPVVMYLEHNLYDNIDPGYDGAITLIDDSGNRHPVYKDRNNRNHLLLSKDICLLPILDSLYNIGLRYCRIEAQHLQDDALSQMLDLYVQAIEEPDKCRDLFNTIDNKSVFTFGAFEFKGEL